MESTLRLSKGIELHDEKKTGARLSFLHSDLICAMLRSANGFRASRRQFREELANCRAARAAKAVAK